MSENYPNLEKIDKDVLDAIQKENVRQNEHVELIASENYTSLAVMEAQGSQLTNKYAEGYPYKRYYGGCKYVDIVEKLAIERAKTLFNADYANVQPHSGSQANAAVFLALLNVNDTILSMRLDHGGHLTHGARVSFSGKNYKVVSYGIDEKTGKIDYDEVEKLAKKYNPKLIIGGFSSYSRIVDWQKLREIADSIGAYLFVDMAHVAGLVATGEYPSPVAIADVVTSTTHKTLRGPRGGIILAKKNEAIEKKLQSAVFPGTQGGPLMHIIAAKAVAFKEAMSDDFKKYQRQVRENIQVMADVFLDRGVGLVSGGTDNHLLVLDLTKKGITGLDLESKLDLANITVNKNTLPNDIQPPFITGGIRIGTPAITTRGFKKEQCSNIANYICDIIDNINDHNVTGHVRMKVLSMCDKFPVY